MYTLHPKELQLEIEASPLYEAGHILYARIVLPLQSFLGRTANAPGECCQLYTRCWQPSRLMQTSLRLEEGHPAYEDDSYALFFWTAVRPPVVVRSLG